KPWREKVNWDTLLDDIYIQQWEKIRDKFRLSTKINVPRRFDIGKDMVDYDKDQLHVFYDASAKAYRAVIYYVAGTGCSLIMAKTKVAPLTPIQLADKIIDAPHVTSSILDGPAVVEMLKPGGSKTFQEYSAAVFIPYIESQLEYRSRLDLVWDCYLKSGSLKATVRCNHGKAFEDASLPLVLYLATGKTFSSTVTTKRNSSVSCQNRLCKSKQLVVTDKKQVLTVPPRKDTANLAPCNHEEADTRMMVHAADALKCGHRRILIRTVDTDVVILAVALANERRKNRRCIAAPQIAKALGPEKSRALPVFHAITGCDTVSVFAGHSKKAAWAKWNAFPEVTTAFLSLASTPSELPDGVLSTLARFIVLLYDRMSTCCDVNVLRKKLFSRKSKSLEHLPPVSSSGAAHKESCLSGWTYLGTGRNSVCQSAIAM
ncbi:putative Pao retrotransposon peptidase-containing protein, partial [Homarus americanus]